MILPPLLNSMLLGAPWKVYGRLSCAGLLPATAKFCGTRNMTRKPLVYTQTILSIGATTEYIMIREYSTLSSDPHTLTCGCAMDNFTIEIPEKQ